MAGYTSERNYFLPSWEISISSSFVCLIPNLWGIPAGTHHPRGRNYPCRDNTIPVYFCSLNYCEGRTWWQGSRAVSDWSTDLCQACTMHSIIPVTSVPPFSTLCLDCFYGCWDPRYRPALCDY